MRQIRVRVRCLPSDYIEFFGVGIDNYHTKDNVYWLGLGAGGPMMSARSGAVAGGAVRDTHCMEQLNRDASQFEGFWHPGLAPEHDRWFIDGVDFYGDYRCADCIR